MRALIVLLIVLCAVPAFGNSISLTWTAPTQNAGPDCAPDGTPLTDLAGYRVMWGLAPGIYTQMHDIDDPAATSYTVDVGDQEGNTVYFVVEARDLMGNYSCPSNEMSVPFGMVPPAPPTLTGAVAQ